MSSRSAPLSCQALTKRFGRTMAVEDVSFEVPEGTITGFVGANGAGKTTTMRMLLGLVTPTSGEALVGGRPYRELVEPRRVVGAALDGPGAHPGRRARTHLAIVATAARLPAGRVDEVLDLVELGAHVDRRVGTFSLGMRQRLALATALLGDPQVLVLDEPANGLDPPGMIWMRHLLRALAADGRAILVSSHLLGELAEVADRMVVIDRGRLVASAPLADLLDRGRVDVRCADPALLAAALQERGAVATADGGLISVEGLSARDVGELVATAGAGPVYELTERAPRFEDAYLALAGTLATAAEAPEGRPS